MPNEVAKVISGTWWGSRTLDGSDERLVDGIVEIIAGHSGFVARGHRPFALQPLEQAADLSRVVRVLARPRRAAWAA